MEYFVLNNGVKMPKIGLGVFRCNPEETFNTVKSAIESGYRHIDTAKIYGNEQYVGEAIKYCNIKREELFITTKLWNEDQRNNTQRQAIEESLKKLGLDYVDLYLIHWPVKEKYVDSWKVMENIYNEGLAKAVGVSNYNIHHLEDLKNVSDLVPVVNQVECHPELTQKNILKYCTENNILMEAWSPLGANKNNILENEILKTIADKYEKTPAQIILRWDIECGIAAIPKSSNEQRQKQNIDIFDFELSNEEIEKINNINKNIRVGSDPDNFNF